MRRHAVVSVVLGLCASTSFAQNLLTNGTLDRTYQQEIIPTFFLPKPLGWENIGTRAISGPFEDEMSSEPWAGPAPTPVTTEGSPPADPGLDNAVFLKPFTGNATDGPTTAHLQQSVAGSPGLTYTMTGWAGAEPNALMADAVFAIDFLADGGGVISSVELSLLPTLYIDNGEDFDYKQYTVSGVAPAGTNFVQARASMIGAQPNPLGGGQAFVMDDFSLVVPEPSSMALALIAGAFGLRRSRRA